MSSSTHTYLEERNTVQARKTCLSKKYTFASFCTWLIDNSLLFFLNFSRILQLEEEYIQRVCSDIISLKPDVVFTEKGVSGKISNII